MPDASQMPVEPERTYEPAAPSASPKTSAGVGPLEGLSAPAVGPEAASAFADAKLCGVCEREVLGQMVDVNNKLTHQTQQVVNPDGTSIVITRTDTGNQMEFRMERLDKDGKGMGYAGYTEFREKVPVKTAPAGGPPDDPFDRMKLFVNGSEKFEKIDLAPYIEALQKYGNNRMEDMLK